METMHFIVCLTRLVLCPVFCFKFYSINKLYIYIKKVACLNRKCLAVLCPMENTVLQDYVYN